MNYLNRNEFEFCNIPEWHNRGFTGKGVKVALVETTPGGDHANKVKEVLLQVAPGCTVEVLKYDLFGARRYAEFNLVSVSLAAWMVRSHIRDEEIKAFESGTTLVFASGNEGESLMSTISKEDYALAVGAVHLTNNTPIRPSYSSTGEELDLVGFSNLKLASGKRVAGTSFAAPFITGMIALYCQAYFEKFGRYPTPDQTREFALTNTIDLELEGHDRNTGHGLFILPDPKMIKEVIEVNKPNKIIIHHSATRDSEHKEFDGIKNHHINTNQWADIGYHYVVEKVNGKYVTIKGRSEDAAGVHCPGQNSQSIGICLVGDFRQGNPPKDQLEETARLIKEIYSRRGELPLYKHSDFRPTECPVFDLKLIKDLLVEKEEEIMSWEEKQGLEHLESLVKKGIMNSADYWKDKMLEPMPVWAILSLIDRITDK